MMHGAYSVKVLHVITFSTKYVLTWGKFYDEAAMFLVLCYLSFIFNTSLSYIPLCIISTDSIVI